MAPRPSLSIFLSPSSLMERPNWLAHLCLNGGKNKPGQSEGGGVGETTQALGREMAGGKDIS